MNRYAPVAANQFGFSLKPSRRIRGAIKKVGKVVGKVADSRIAKGLVAAGLAATGVGVGASAAIMAAQSAGAKAAKGARLKTIVKGGVTGAATGAAAGLVGKVLPKAPGLKRPVGALRRKLGRAPAKPKSYDSDSRLDALASGPLPSVGITRSLPTTVTPSPTIFRAIEMRDASAERAKRKGAETMRVAMSDAAALEKAAGAARARESREPDPVKKRGLRDKAAELLKSASARKTAGAAAQMAASVLMAPDGNPLAPQGGFPPLDMDGTRSSAMPSDNGSGALASLGSNPALLVAGAVVLMMLVSRNK